jgi:hypothetical protein
MKKLCTKCNQTKDVVHFSKWSRVKSGYQSWCKQCDKEYREKRKLSHPDIVKKIARDKMRRWRENNPEKELINHRQHYANRQEKAQNHQREYSKANLPKRRAQNIVYRAIKKGLLTRQPCETCGKDKTEAHHQDYSKPLEVNWLCTKHHRRLHSWID